MKGKHKTFFSQVLNNMGDIKTACPPKLNVKERKVLFLNWRYESCLSIYPILFLSIRCLLCVHFLYWRLRNVALDLYANYRWRENKIHFTLWSLIIWGTSKLHVLLITCKREKRVIHKLKIWELLQQLSLTVLIHKSLLDVHFLY